MSPDHAAAEIEALLGDVAATGSVHARSLGDDGPVRELAVRADEPAVAASVIKILFAVAFSRAVVDGELDGSERVVVPDHLRIGGSGAAGFIDAPAISLRDLALSMMTVSDNAASDLILERVGHNAVRQVISDLDLTGTHLRHDILAILQGARHARAEISEALRDEPLAVGNDALLRSHACLDPARTNAMTARDATSLLAAVWNDQAGPPRACAMVRMMMAQQLNTQRLASGFPEDVAVAGKTGTLPTLRNEAGVVTCPDGRAFAVAVFIRVPSLGARNAPVDAVIGRIAATAVMALGLDRRSRPR